MPRIAQVRARLELRDWYLERHRRLYQAILMRKHRHQILSIAQYEGDLIVRVRRRGSDRSGEPPVRVHGVFGRWPELVGAEGPGLPDAVLRKIYYQNALRHLPAMRQSIQRQLSARR